MYNYTATCLGSTIHAPTIDADTSLNRPLSDQCILLECLSGGYSLQLILVALLDITKSLIFPSSSPKTAQPYLHTLFTRLHTFLTHEAHARRIRSLAPRSPHSKVAANEVRALLVLEANSRWAASALIAEIDPYAGSLRKAEVGRGDSGNGNSWHGQERRYGW
ncbi:hypothetical protein HGRIS_004311 [Hohenbuehelia grisea]|uniref:Uncharacterized protein n=1 Tax=Hohenbuehelia grisea TaxID=104357 RepID=A0ABR3IPD8_9AGAR